MVCPVKTMESITKWGLILGGVWGFCFSPYAYSEEDSSLSAMDVESVDTLDHLVDDILSEECLVIYETDVETVTLVAQESEEEYLANSEPADSFTYPSENTLPLVKEEAPSTPTLQMNCCPMECPTYCCPEVCESVSRPGMWSRFCSVFCDDFGTYRAGSRSHQLFPYIRANAGRGIGFDYDYTTLGAMYSTLGARGCFQPFLDFKWHCFTDRKNAANMGIGVRYLSCGCDLIYGANAYYDYRDGCFADFHQLGLGFELLSRCFEFRVNAYFPFQCEGCRHKTVFDDYIGDFFVSCQRCDFTMRGADAEAGAVLFCCRGFRVLLGAGAYYYNDNFNHHALGARGRLNIRYSNHVGFDLYATTDKVFRNRVQGQFYICLPFSCFSSCRRDNCNTCCSPLACVACQPVYRNDMIVLKQGCCWDFNFDDTIKKNGCSSCSSCSCGCR